MNSHGIVDAKLDSADYVVFSSAMKQAQEPSEFDRYVNLCKSKQTVLYDYQKNQKTDASQKFMSVQKSWRRQSTRNGCC